MRVLERLGHTVEFPEQQTCCGQMHFNTGYASEAVPLMIRFLDQFQDAEAIVVPSSSCVAMMRENYPALARTAEERGGHARLSKRVDDVVARVYEFSEFLTKRLGIQNVGAYYPHRVTYHASCHGIRNLKLGDGPVRLLQAVECIDLVPIQNAQQCCGFGGTFAIKNADVSGAMLSEKIDAVLNTGAEVCTACDNSCLMHIEGALHRQRTGVRTVHLAQILASTKGAEFAP